MTLQDRRRAAALSHGLPLSVSVIIPFHSNLFYLSRCLSSLLPLPPLTEIIVAADRPTEDCDRVAFCNGARVVHVAGRGGPAAARNCAAAASRSEVLIFIDADVVVSSRALHAMVHEFATNPTMAAVFGAYDDDPACQNFFSQYKNLTHRYVHTAGGRVARSFWAGFGGVRSDVFRSIGGFDERFTRPCIEDIELGDRMTAAGHHVLIDRRLQACHLKRWTFRSMVASDVWDRGVPWTELILSSRRFHNTLNLDVRSRLSVVLCYTALVCIALGNWQPTLLAIAATAIATVLFLNRRLYVFLSRRRGAWFAVRAAAMNLMYHLYNGASFVLGVTRHCADRVGAMRSRYAARAAVES